MRRFRREEQVANACDSFVDLTPASEVPAAEVRSAWAAVRHNSIPFIWDTRRSYGDTAEDDAC